MRKSRAVTEGHYVTVTPEPLPDRPCGGSGRGTGWSRPGGFDMAGLVSKYGALPFVMLSPLSHGPGSHRCTRDRVWRFVGSLLALRKSPVFIPQAPPVPELVFAAGVHIDSQVRDFAQRILSWWSSLMSFAMS